MLLKEALDALPAGGAFIVFEALIDDERRENTLGLLMSLNMLIETPDGFDYIMAMAKVLRPIIGILLRVISQRFSINIS